MATVPEAGAPTPRACPICMVAFEPDELVAMAVWDDKVRALGPMATLIALKLGQPSGRRG